MKNRGCLNPECNSCKNRVLYKAEMFNCPECGSELQIVCTGKHDGIRCYTPLSGTSKKLCARCEAVRNDKRTARKARFKREAIGLAGVVVYGLKDELPQLAKKGGAIAVKAGKNLKVNPEQGFKIAVNVVKKLK